MDFNLEWEIKLFREEQPSLFDETGKRYSATPIGDKTAERMLNIINLFECAAAKRHEQESNCNKTAVSKCEGIEREALLRAFQRYHNDRIGFDSPLCDEEIDDFIKSL
jgi:hypothetical protein